MLRTLSRTRSQTQTAPRRSNSRRPPSILVTAVDSPTYRRKQSSLTLPTEIVDRIIELALAAVAQGNDLFSSISSFSVASVHFRRIFMRRFLERVDLRSKKHWNWIFKLARRHGIRNGGDCGLVEIKSLVADSGTVITESSNLSDLVNLRKLNLSFEEEGPSTQHTCVTVIFKNLHCASSLQELNLTFLPRIDITLLRLISDSFPLLSNLHLSATDRVDNYNMIDICWCCFEELLSCSYHAPIPYMFSTPEGLATAFGQALQKLKNLECLHLGVYLSDEELWWNHIPCCKSGQPVSPEKCNKCQDLYSLTTRTREDAASTVLVSVLPSLRQVSWSSYFNVKSKREGQFIGDSDGRVYFDVQQDGRVLRRRVD
ncbi:hypothetical protein AAF712_006922 [Marasmius tenuissimus]|uniref:F-box domain-containing protein n=1 Tax=Marasmius tenuissimus TaxID=585030 RepID=A0ABR2ZYD9_9AGAR|nr:hypothetical protein PM082_010294 [Marasmius tenuissimus]